MEGPVALFGGSFNPPHVVHGMVCLYLLQTGCAQVWVVPTYAHAFAKALAPFEDRLRMCERLVEPLGGRVRVLDIEASLSSPSYTVDTVRALRRAHPGVAFQWVVGSDILGELPRWKDVDALKQLVDFRVLHRGGYGAPPGELSFPELSSTAIRQALARGESPSGLLPGPVLTYIRERGLYGASPSPLPAAKEASTP